MSKYLVVSVRDSAVGLFAIPQCVVSKGSAVRSFGDEVQRADSNNPLNKHPKDFALYELGVFNDESGTFDSHEPQLIVNAADFASVV